VLLALISLFVISVATAIQPSHATPAMIYVSPGESIQDAIDSANQGDVVVVREGVYIENVYINKVVSLLAEGAVTVKSADPNWSVFHVRANRVNITGFTVTGATGLGKAGIFLDTVEHAKISYNNASGNYYGILLSFSNKNKILCNLANSNDHSGICIYSSNNNTLVNNTANSNNMFGILLPVACAYNLFVNNTANSNGDNGINLRFSDNYNILVGNTANSNTNGIFLYAQCNNNRLVNNTVSLNYESGIAVAHSSNNNTLVGNIATLNNYCGLLISQSNNNMLARNFAKSNQYSGIWLGSSNCSILVNNTVEKNSYNGIELVGLSSSNLIYHNNLVDNKVRDGYDENPPLNYWYHPALLEGNYWSDYDGLDDGNGVEKHSIAGDGIGDTLIPHPSADYDRYPFTSQNGWKPGVEGSLTDREPLDISFITSY